jgi:hypothetical protein
MVYGYLLKHILESRLVMIISRNIIISAIAVLICIVIMLLCLMLLFGHDGGRKKARRKVRRRHTRAKGSSSRIHSATRHTVPDGQPDASPAGKPLPKLKSQTDDEMQKYAEITKSFIRSNYASEIKVVGLKKYHSKRHGFDCIDFTYRLESGMTPAAFRQAMNHMDTALSNVSGVDTLTFAVDGSPDGLYRTTFYLGK